MKILLNGIGRIGKAILQIASNFTDIKIVVINELNSNIENIAYSINYDSTYNKLDDKYVVKNNFIQNSTNKIKILNCYNLINIDFEDIDIIIDSSGNQENIDKLRKLDVKAIFITHPRKEADINIILGANEKQLNPNEHKIISTSSCNATALLPILKLIDENYGINFGDISTIHPLLNHQKVLDSTCVGSNNRGIKCNFEFGRSSTQNIIPSGTTTIEACSYVLPEINNEILSSNSLRVPTDTVGVINVTLFTKKSVIKEKLLKLFELFQINQQFKIIFNNYETLVSSDFKKENYTSIIDHRFTDVKMNKMIKLVLWYDNEWGYASKVVDILRYYVKTLKNKRE